MCLDVVEVTLVRGESGVDPWLSADRVVVVMVGEGTGGAITDFDSAQMPSRGEIAIGAVPVPDKSPPAPRGGGGGNDGKCCSFSKNVVLREPGAEEEQEEEP